jgi:SAM-dependent methyltransferase
VEAGRRGSVSIEACTRRRTCRLCAGSELTLAFSLTPTPPANAFIPEERLAEEQPVFPLNLFFCETCKHLQLLDVVDPEILFRDYVYVSGTSASFVKHFEDYADYCATRFAPYPGALAVDIGSNDGTFLRFFERRGFRVLGIDPANKIAAEATKSGIETWAEFFDLALSERILEKHGTAAIVTANNVFAHADDLAGIADGVAALLGESGVFIFEVSYAPDVYEKTLFDTIYHEHLAYHTVLPLIGFFKSRGMELFSVEHVESHGGSIRCMVQPGGGAHASDGSVEAAALRERQLGLDRVETWIAYASKIEARKEELSSLLAGLISDGKMIAGFGAPAKATTLMYHFGIGPDVIDFIADDSPLKQGLYSPGLHIPVLSAAEIYARRPDYLVILAWNFAKPIMQAHAAFREQGGKFIVPLPHLEVH